ncbi:hypothetical protein ACLOJK_013009 [Asimina triloba]
MDKPQELDSRSHGVVTAVVDVYEDGARVEFLGKGGAKWEKGELVGHLWYWVVEGHSVAIRGSTDGDWTGQQQPSH